MNSRQNTQVIAFCRPLLLDVLLRKLTNNGLPFKRFLKCKKNVVKLITFNLVDITKVNITRNFIINFAFSKHVTAIMLFL